MGWKDQFKWKKFLFSYDHPEQLVLCQWQTNTSIPESFLLYRMLYLIFYLGIWYVGLRMVDIAICCGCLKCMDKGSFLLYYTTWSEIFCCLAAASSMLITVVQYVNEDEEAEKQLILESKTWFKIHMVIYTLALDSSVSVAFGYFGYVYYNERRLYHSISYVLHLWTAVLMLLDFMLSSMPTNLLHFYLMMMMALVYGFFTVIYYLAGGKNYLGQKYLYAILNWEDAPWTAVLAIFGTFLVFLVVRVFIYALSRIRDRIFYKCYYLGSESTCTRSFIVVH